MKGFNWRRFAAVVKKEVRQVIRDPISLGMAILLPAMLMFLFGYALSTEVDNIPTAILDKSQSTDSRELVQRFVVSGYFSINTYVENEDQLKNSLDSGNAKAGLVIPGDYARNNPKGNNQALLIIDGSDPTTAKTALNSGLLLAEADAKEVQDTLMKKSGTTYTIAPPALIAHVWYNQDLKSIRFTIPGLVGLITQFVTVVLTAFAMVREKERGTIEQLIVTPIRPSELILGKLIPYVFIGYSGFLVALFLCVVWFGITPAGSILLLLALGIIFVICSLMIGMLISTFAKTQSQAMLALVMVQLPTVLLSGFIFPREAMPDVIKAIGYVLPLTYFLNITRGIVLKGTGMEFLWFDVAMLSAMTILLAGVAIFRFRKSLD